MRPRDGQGIRPWTLRTDRGHVPTQQVAMSNAPDGAAASPMVEEGPEGGNDDEEETVEEIVDLRTCHPKPNGRSLD